jgi:hypothetical protein
MSVMLRVVLLPLVLNVFDAAAASTEWLEVRKGDRVNPPVIAAVEFVAKSDAAGEHANLALPGYREGITDASLAVLAKMVADTAVWLHVQETAVAPVSRSHVRLLAIMGVQFSCPTEGSCAAYLEGVDATFSRQLADRGDAVKALQALVKTNAFVLTEGDRPGYEGYVRVTEIRRAQLTCAMGNCTRADLTLSDGRVRTTRDQKGLAAIQTLIQ